jgi:hypothetical protein
MYVTVPYQSRFRLTQSQYELKNNIELLRDLIYQLEEQCLIHISIVVHSLT